MFNRQQYNKEYYLSHKGATRQRLGYRKILCVRGHLRSGDNLYTNGKCKQCETIHRKKWSDSHPEMKAVYMTRYRQANKRRLIELAGGKCVRCGFNEHPSALDFDHINPSTKINKRSISCLKLETAIKELQNRMLLCANCHRIKTWAPELF